MADSTIKNISLTGGAADDYTRHATGAKKRRGGRRTRKQSKDEFDEFAQFGGDSPMGPEIPLTQSNTSRSHNLSRAINITKVGGSTQKGGSNIDQTTNRQPPVQLPVISTAANTSVGTVAQNTEALKTLPAVRAQIEAGTQPTSPLTITKTVVGGGKAKPSVFLAPKKHKSHILLAPPTSSKKPGTRSANVKETRKVKVHLANMKKRVTTAKIIHKDSKEKSIEEIRRLLEEAKLVKPAKEGKKVPEDILRNIYKDYLILRNKAL